VSSRPPTGREPRRLAGSDGVDASDEVAQRARGGAPQHDRDREGAKHEQRDADRERGDEGSDGRLVHRRVGQRDGKPHVAGARAHGRDVDALAAALLRGVAAGQWPAGARDAHVAALGACERRGRAGRAAAVERLRGDRVERVDPRVERVRSALAGDHGGARRGAEHGR
jgi:hypothetical protein